jgi:hypothetical protein
MPFLFYVFPTEFDSRIDVTNVQAEFEKNINKFLNLKNNEFKLLIEKWDVLGNPFRYIPWEIDEEFSWTHHEVEEVNIFQKIGSDNKSICCIWNDYLTSTYVGTLDDFVPNTLSKEIEKKIERFNIHWRFDPNGDSLSDLKVQLTIIMGATLAKLCDGIIMSELAYQNYQEDPLIYEGFLPLSVEKFLELTGIPNFFS